MALDVKIMAEEEESWPLKIILFMCRTPFD